MYMSVFICVALPLMVLNTTRPSGSSVGRRHVPKTHNQSLPAQHCLKHPTPSISVSSSRTQIRKLY